MRVIINIVIFVEIFYFGKVCVEPAAKSNRCLFDSFRLDVGLSKWNEIRPFKKVNKNEQR